MKIIIEPAIELKDEAFLYVDNKCIGLMDKEDCIKRVIALIRIMNFDINIELKGGK